MTKEEYISLAESYYVDIEILNDSPTFYDYEKSLFELMQKLSCDLIQLSGVPFTLFFQGF